MQLWLDAMRYFGQTMIHVLQEIFWITPVFSFLIAAILLVWSKSFLGEIELAHYASSFKSAQKGQWWRLLTSPFFHHNPGQMLLNVLILWQCRYVEQVQGSMFVLRYTVVLALAEGVTSLGILFLIAMGMRARMRMQQSADSMFSGLGGDEDEVDQRRMQSLAEIIVAQPFGSKPKAGFSGLSLAWVSFMMVTMPLQYFYLFGVIPIQAAFAPVTIIMSLLFVEPAHQVPAQSAGFACGLLLALGLLQIEPNVYWSVSFTIDLMLVLVFQHFEALYIEECRQSQSLESASASSDLEESANVIGLLHPRFNVPQSILGLHSYSDQGLPVRFWPETAASIDVREDLGASAGPGAGAGAGAGDVNGAGEGVEVEMTRLSSGDDEEQGRARRRREPQAPDAEPEAEAEAESKEWDSLLNR